MIKGVNLRLNATNKGGPAMSSFRKGMKGIQTAQKSVTRSNVGFAKGMNANRRIIQQVGFQLSDFGVQIAGGQSAILSLTQNVPQVVQMFGAWGGILAALITFIGTFTLVMTKSGKGIKDIIPFAGALQDEFRGIAAAMGVVKESVLNGVNLMINNLDVLFISLSLIAAFMVKKWVVSFLTSTGTLRLFNTALLVTQKRGLAAGAALIRARAGALLFSRALKIVSKAIIATGIGALIIAAGVLIERMLTLKEVTGSWGATFKLLGTIAKQVFKQIPLFSLAMQVKMNAVFANIKAAWLTMLADMIGGVSDWVNEVTAAFSAVSTGASVFGLIVEAGKRGDLKTAKALGSRMGEFVTTAYSDSLSKASNKGTSLITKLTGSADQAKKAAASYDIVAKSLFDGANNAIPAWRELKSLMGSADSTDFDIRSVFGSKADTKESEDRFKNAMANAGRWIKETQEQVKRFGAANDAAEKAATKAANDRFKNAMASAGRWVKETKARIKTLKPVLTETQKLVERIGADISASFSSNFKGLLKGTQSFKGTILGVLDTVLDKMLDVALNPIFDAIGGSLAGGIGSLFASFDGGGFTGKGVRAGGLDNKGGKLAVLHPNETVMDHTKNGSFSGGGSSGGGMTVFNTKNYFNGYTPEQIMKDVETSQEELEKRMVRNTPSLIKKYQKDSERGMV